jgi:hypothetical protein
MSDHCGTTTEEGNDVCVPGACNCSSETQNNAPILLSVPLLDKITGVSKQPITKLMNVVISNTSEEKSHVAENS